VDGNAPEMPDRIELDHFSVPNVEVIPPAPSSQNTSSKSDMPDFSKFRALSWVMFGAFLILTLISANWMIQGWQTKNFGWGFWLSWIPFAVGILGMATSLNSRWLHLRVREGGYGHQKNIRISMPLPLGLASWILNANPQWLPQEVRDKHIGETLHEINHSITREDPFYLEVDEGDQHVEIYIG
jgi:hypothetical protein